MIIRSIIIKEKYNMITIQELKTKIDQKTRLLGIDMGSKKIGVSICDDKRLIATPFHTINFTSLDKLIVDLKKLINENIEFKSDTNFSVFLLSNEILDNLDICFTVLRSILI